MVIQTTHSNERRERTTMRPGQNTPFLDMLRANVASLRAEVIEDTGHFPQLDEPARTNALMTDFLAGLR
jgi:pimeloyl-ACP methyl ester carboxylesterase